MPPESRLATSPADTINAIVARHPVHPAFPVLARLRRDQPDAARYLRDLLMAYPELVERLVSSGTAVTSGQAGLAQALAEGIDLLGFRPVHATAVLTSVIRAFDGATNHLDAVAFWRQAALAGAAAGAIGGIEGSGLDEQASVGALLVHLGWLALDESAPGYLERLVEVAGDRAPEEPDEVVAFGFTVRALTEALLRAWKTPDEIANAALHAAIGSQATPLASVILRGIRAADAMLAGEEPEEAVGRGIPGRARSTASLLTRVDALLAGVMLT